MWGTRLGDKVMQTLGSMIMASHTLVRLSGGSENARANKRPLALGNMGVVRDGLPREAKKLIC